MQSSSLNLKMAWWASIGDELKRVTWKYRKGYWNLHAEDVNNGPKHVFLQISETGKDYSQV